jgi:hypothetical protein
MSLITGRETAFKDSLENPDTFGTILLAILLDEYGPEAFDWEPAALSMQLRDDFHAKIPDVNIDKLWAMITGVSTNQFFVNNEIFLNTCKALGGDEADFAMFRPVTPEELAWGVTEILLNNPPDPKLGNSQFSDEIENMVGLLLSEQGVLQAPKVLEFAVLPTGNPAYDPELMFSDDQPMLQAVLANQKEQTSQIDAGVKERMHQLKAQLDALPLHNRAK